VTASPDIAGRPQFVLGRGVVDGTGTGLREGEGVLIRDGRVVAVGTPGNIEPAEAQRVDAGRAVIVPGFVDSHTHVTIRPGEGNQHGQIVQPPVWQTIRGVENLRRMIASGVTTARIMTEEADIDLEYRAAIARGEIVGPRLRVSGRGFSPPGGHGSSAGGVAGVDDLRAAVREHASKGVDHIKIFATGGVSSENSSLDDSLYSAEEIAAIVDEAAAAGLRVSAHALAGRGLELAVENGCYSVEHGSVISEETAAEMVRRGTWLVFTSAIAYHPSGIEQGDAKSPTIMAKLEEDRVAARRTARLVREAGVRMAIGTDSMHGLFGYEMEWLVEQGWTPAEALTAATKSGAELVGVPDAGTLEPGKRADLVLLREDPLSDITAVYDVAGVYRDGIELVTADGFVRPPAGGGAPVTAA
jgi:imidazolonepropionase-like amidohydrolase